MYSASLTSLDSSPANALGAANQKIAWKDLSIKAFNEAVLLHLLFLHALVLVNTLAELDASIGMPGLRLGLSSLTFGIRPILNYLFQVVMGPAPAVAPPPDGGGATACAGPITTWNR